jgi:23S rRNA (uracil1939-C5)-methyltransferase
MAQTNAKNEITLEIDSFSYGPYGIGRADGKAVMVPQTVPGDTVAARIVESKERYAIGETLRLIKPSPLRQAPPCPYVSECGGCPWQHIRYDVQLKAKERNVEDALRRIGKLDRFELRPIIPSPSEYYYRRRIRLHQDRRKKLGFFRAFSHDLIEVNACLIADRKLNGLIEPLRRWFRELATPMEYVEIGTGDEACQIVVFGKASQEFISLDHATCERFLADTTGINGLILQGRNWRRVWGQASITVKLGDDLSLTVDGDVFTQVNSEGNRRMLRELLKDGEFQNDDRVLELFSGAGNFTLAVAKCAHEVVAVESYEASVTNGRLNAQKNDLNNVRWIHAAVPSAVARLKRRREKFSKIILDPPRAGAKYLDGDLASFDAQRILYISCNPTTLARDLAALAKHGYRLKSVQPIDLFPHTFHVESLATLAR